MNLALPLTVIEDGPEWTLLYAAPGTPMKRRAQPDGSPIPREMGYAERMALPYAIADTIWATNHALIVIQPGVAHDVRFFWSGEWEFRGSYVNLIQPVMRVATGFDTADHVLDIAVDPDGTWRWKDEGEFTDAVERGRFSVEEAADVRAEGERMIPAIEARKWPFDGSFENWRPDPAWPVPVMPDNWNEDE